MLTIFGILNALVLFAGELKTGVSCIDVGLPFSLICLSILVWWELLELARTKMSSDDLTFKFSLFFVLSAFVEFALIWYTAIKFETITTPILSYVAVIGIPAAIVWLVNKYIVSSIKDETRKLSIKSSLWMLIEILLQALAVFLVAYAAH